MSPDKDMVLLSKVDANENKEDFMSPKMNAGLQIEGGSVTEFLLSDDLKET